MVYDCVVGLGANLGDRLATLASAVRALAELGTVSAVSHVYETAPVGPPQPAFLNAAARLLVPTPPESLLQRLLEIELAFGRERRERWGPRTLDLDILWVRDVVRSAPTLTVPHAELAARPFALVPLLDVAPDATDPRTGASYENILRGLDRSSVQRVAASLGNGSDLFGNAP